MTSLSKSLESSSAPLCEPKFCYVEIISSLLKAAFIATGFEDTYQNPLFSGQKDLFTGIQ